MRKVCLMLLVMAISVSGLLAEITFSGDARVRPRMDIKDNGDYGNKTSDFYYLYRARILVSADIGDGYYFKTRLGHNGVAYWIGSFGTGTLPNAGSNPAAGRGTVDFMELYFGHKGDAFSWAAGLIPVTGTPLTDIHFYPTKVVDLPYLIFNNNAHHGFDFSYSLMGNPLNMKILVDNNAGIKTAVDGKVVDSLSTKDQYTFDVSYPISLGGIKLVPEVLFTQADEGNAAPMTYGAEFALPKVAGFGVSAFAGLTSQGVADAGKYTGWIARAKLVGNVGPGGLTAWYDIAAITPDEGETQNHGYLWLSYTYTMYKSDKGAVTFAPTYRLVSQKTKDTKDYTRAKIELTTQITFK